jgi:hypothetical protein
MGVGCVWILYNEFVMIGEGKNDTRYTDGTYAAVNTIGWLRDLKTVGENSGCQMTCCVWDSQLMWMIFLSLVCIFGHIQQLSITLYRILTLLMTALHSLSRNVSL